MKNNITLYLFASLIITFNLNIISCSRDYRTDRLFKSYAGDDKPGAALMIIDKGQEVVVKTYGMANLEDGIPVKRHTNFRLASVTKQFTAMSVMILEECGRLNYNNNLKDIFPEFPDYGREITIRNLLQHTSGLIAYEDLIPDTATVQVSDRDVLSMMMQVDSTYFEPGASYRYSNSGYAVLAMIVEQISGKPFAKFLKDEIFIPLNMINTVAFEKGISKVENRALGYAVESDSVIFSDQSRTSAVLGDGGIYTSIEDLYKWDQALYTEKLVSNKTLQKAFTPELENYGFGWRIDEYKGHYRVHHTGSTCGFRTVIQRYTEDEFTIIILTNRRDPDVANIADELTDMYLLTR